MADRLVYRNNQTGCGILVEVRPTGTPSILESLPRLSIEQDGSVFDTETLKCYDSVDDWFISTSSEYEDR